MPARLWDQPARRLLVASLEGTVNADTVRETITALAGAYARGVPFLNITILRRDFELRAADRNLAGRLFAEQNEVARRFMLASAVIAESPLQRGLLTAVTWINPAPHPQRVFGELAPAVVWLNEWAQKEGIEPIALRELDLLLDARRPTHPIA